MKKGNFLGIVKTNEELQKFFSIAKNGDRAFLKVGAYKPKYIVYEVREGLYWEEIKVFDPYKNWR